MEESYVQPCKRACSTENLAPHPHVDRVGRGCHLHRRASASWNMWSAKPNSSIGQEVSQVEAPFSWARSMDHLREWGRDFFSCSDACLACSHFSLCTSVFAQVGKRQQKCLSQIASPQLKILGGLLVPYWLKHWTAAVWYCSMQHMHSTRTADD